MSTKEVYQARPVCLTGHAPKKYFGIPFSHASRGMGGIAMRRRAAGGRTRGVAIQRSGSQGAKAPADGPGMPPVRRLRRPALHGIRAERDLRVRGRYGSAGCWVGNRAVRHPDQRSHPSSGLVDLPGPSACVGRAPVAIAAKGDPIRRAGVERHRSVRAQSRRSGGPGWAFGSLPAPAPSPMATPGSVNKAGPRVALRGSRRAGNGAQRCFLHGVTRCFPS